MPSATLSTAVARLGRSVLPLNTDGTDGELLDRFVGTRDESAFAELVRRLGPMVLGVCQRVTEDAHLAEDAFQAAFLVLARRAADVRPREAVRGWLHGVATRTAQKARVMSARCRAREVLTAILPECPTTTPTEPDPDALRALDEELAALPEHLRAAVVLCELDGLSRKAAAVRLGLPEGTLSSRLAKARHLLASRLRSRGVVLGGTGLSWVFGRLASAAVPVRLASATSALANGSVPVPAAVTVLSEGVLRSMFLTKLKTVGLGVLLLAATCAVGWVAVPKAAAQEPPKPAVGLKSDPEPLAAPKAPPAPPRAEVKDVEVSGRVLGPDGKPFVGAQLFVTDWSARRENQKILATTGDDGRFRIRVLAAEVKKSILVAAAAGHGPDRINLGKGTDDVTLRLVKDDVPITGRVLDLEGRPVVGATIRITWADVVDLKPWLEDPTRVELEKKKGLHVAMLEGPLSVKTDKDGRFRLSGFGRDRVAHLSIRSAGVENTDVEVIARDGNVGGLLLESRVVYPPGANFTVRPSKPIVGTVRDKKTGKPIAGIRVVCPGPQWDWPNATTDEKGHYKIDGVSKQKEYVVGAGGPAYFNASRMEIADTQGLDPLMVDFDLDRGSVVRGRLTDSVTGLPVRGRVHYGPAGDNPNLKDFTEFGKPQVLATDSGRTGEDGSFAILAIPGKGQLAVIADDVDAYAMAREDDVHNAVVGIDVSEKDEKSRVCDVALRPARSLEGRVVGPDGKSLTGSWIAGRHQRHGFGEKPEKLAGDSFIVAGLGSTEPRILVFAHPEKKLARVQVVPAGRKDPLTVRLEPTGVLVGRVLDGEGKPLAGVAVKATYSFGQTVEGEGSRGRLPMALRFVDSGWPELLNGQATTDKDGHFRITGLVPGLKYGLQAPGVERGDLSVEPGKDNDLGDLK